MPGALLAVGAHASAEPAARAGSDSTPLSPASDAIDFSNPNSEAVAELSASAYVSLLSGEVLSSVEASLLDGMLAGHGFRYGNAIPPRAIEIDYGESELTVTLRPHSFTAVNGETVTWYPVRLTFESRELPLEPVGEDGSLRTTLENQPSIYNSRMELHYTCTITVPAEASDPYLNYAWSYTDRLISEQTAYEEQKAAHEAQQAAYENYLVQKAEYQLALSAWQTYTEAKRKYDEQNLKYLAYEQELAIYREHLAEYHAYLTAAAEYDQKLAAYEAAYATYVQEKEAYLTALSLYETNAAQIATALDVLATLDSAFARNSQGKQMYATLVGDTVASVVNRRAELEGIAGCDVADIDTADACTAVLQELLTRYSQLGSLPDRFAFYQAHYTELRDNFQRLCGSLRSLYTVDAVKNALIVEGKLERYIEFLLQLYVISTGLDDATDRGDPKAWTVYGRYDSAYYGNIPYVYTDLEEIQRPTDKNNADPTGVVCPSVRLPKPEEPVLSVQKPERPTPVAEPVEPDVVIKPVEPTPVAEPVEPTPIEEPGARPIAPAYTALQEELMAAYRNGTLSRRTEGEDKPLTFTTQLSHQLSQNVAFYEYDEQTLLYSIKQDEGTAIVFPEHLPTPTRPDTDKYTYRFVGWKDQDGNLLSELGVVDEEREIFFASYEATVRSYTVTWKVNDVVTTEELPFGTVPRFDGEPTYEADSQFQYVFTGWRQFDENGYKDGWSTDLPPVQGDVSYEAVFEPLTRRYTVTWLYGPGDSSSAQWEYGTVPTPEKTPTRVEDDRYLYIFTGWDTEPVAVTQDVTYTALFDAIPILPPVSTDDPSAPVQAPVLKDDVYIATVPAEGLRTDRLLELALMRDRTISLSPADGALSLLLTQAVISDLAASGCTYIHLTPANTARSAARVQGRAYSIRFLDADRQELTLQYPVTLRFSNADSYTRVLAETADGTRTLAHTLDGSDITVKIAQCATLHFIGEYPITLLPSENGILTSDHANATAGETVSLFITCTDSYLLDSLRVIGESGQAYDVRELDSRTYTFVMPEEPVSVEMKLALRTYTVVFRVDDVVISSETYYKGDTVKVPADPVKENVGNTVYTFVGWTPHITVVTEDVIYDATFRTSEQSNSGTYIPDSHHREYLLYLEIGLVLAVLIGTPIVTVILIKRHRKKKRARRQENPPTEPTE